MAEKKKKNVAIYKSSIFSPEIPEITQEEKIKHFYTTETKDIFQAPDVKDAEHCRAKSCYMMHNYRPKWEGSAAPFWKRKENCTYNIEYIPLPLGDVALNKELARSFRPKNMEPVEAKLNDMTTQKLHFAHPGYQPMASPYVIENLPHTSKDSTLLRTTSTFCEDFPTPKRNGLDEKYQKPPRKYVPSKYGLEGRSHYTENFQGHDLAAAKRKLAEQVVYGNRVITSHIPYPDLKVINGKMQSTLRLQESVGMKVPAKMVQVELLEPKKKTNGPLCQIEVIKKECCLNKEIEDRMESSHQVADANQLHEYCVKNDVVNKCDFVLQYNTLIQEFLSFTKYSRQEILQQIYKAQKLFPRSFEDQVRHVRKILTEKDVNNLKYLSVKKDDLDGLTAAQKKRIAGPLNDLLRIPM